jgi:hypothetical protein
MNGVVDMATGAAFANAAPFMMLFPCAYCLSAISAMAAGAAATVSARIRSTPRLQYEFRIAGEPAGFNGAAFSFTMPNVKGLNGGHLVLLANEKEVARWGCSEYTGSAPIMADDVEAELKMKVFDSSGNLICTFDLGRHKIPVPRSAPQLKLDFRLSPPGDGFDLHYEVTNAEEFNIDFELDGNNFARCTSQAGSLRIVGGSSDRDCHEITVKLTDSGGSTVARFQPVQIPEPLHALGLAFAEIQSAPDASNACKHQECNRTRAHVSRFRNTHVRTPLHGLMQITILVLLFLALFGFLHRILDILPTSLLVHICRTHLHLSRCSVRHRQFPG